MNEEFKKKYLKYKIKYLELIGGGDTQSENKKLFEELMALIRAAEAAEAAEAAAAAAAAEAGAAAAEAGAAAAAAEPEEEAIKALNEAVEPAIKALNEEVARAVARAVETENALDKLINIMVTNIGELDKYRNNIKKYIEDKHIDKIFKGDQLYKLFIFIVVEFGKLLNCESASEMKTMNKLLYPPHLVIK